MKNLLISGISGKVGNYILNLAKDYNFNTICGIDKNDFISADCPVYKSFSEVKENVDVIIDFSSPALTDDICNFANFMNCPVVIGTTGLNEEENKKIVELSDKVAVCKCNNFSIGILPFLSASKILKEKLNFDIVLTETHNKYKKDAPSGTAKFIAEKLNIDQIHSIRGGNIAGIHTITFLGQDEEIEITHRAYNKSIFARGALLCAKQILTKEKGLYTSEDLII